MNIKAGRVCMEPILKVEHLSKSFGKQKVLDDISFTIKEGEILGFIGPNGAGKSTLMKCICNLIHMDKGNVTICGYDLRKQRKQALDKQSSLIENPGLFPTMTGYENLLLFARLKKCSKERVEEMIAYTHLGNQIHKRVNQYSLGMKQRLALAIALLNKPRFLMLDEPMNGLDPTGVHELREELKIMVEQQNMALLLSSHQLNEIEKISTRIIYIEHGKIRTMDKKESFLCYRFFIHEDKNKIVKQFPQLKNIHQNEYEAVFQSSDEFSSFLQTLGQSGIRIQDVEKVSVDLEDAYSAIYERTL